MAIPRRLIAVAVSAVAAGAVLYFSSRRRGPPVPTAVDEANREKESAQTTHRAAAAAGDTPRPGGGSPPSSSGAPAAGSAPRASGTPTTPTGEAVPSSSSSPSETSVGREGSGGARHELALFLAGDAWHDEVGWQAMWEKESVPTPSGWLRTTGREVLSAVRRRLIEHPALLAGCRRRWIVVCRYGGIDVGEAASLWNQSEEA
jgi:hypothetical protein